MYLGCASLVGALSARTASVTFVGLAVSHSRASFDKFLGYSNQGSFLGASRGWRAFNLDHSGLVGIVMLRIHAGADGILNLRTQPRGALNIRTLSYHFGTGSDVCPTSGHFGSGATKTRMTFRL